MEKNQNLLTIMLVLIIGLIGGYAIAQHTGQAEHSHEEVHEAMGNSRDHMAADAPHADGDIGAEIPAQ